MAIIKVHDRDKESFFPWLVHNMESARWRIWKQIGLLLLALSTFIIWCQYQ